MRLKADLARPSPSGLRLKFRWSLGRVSERPLLLALRAMLCWPKAHEHGSRLTPPATCQRGPVTRPLPASLSCPSLP